MVAESQLWSWGKEHTRQHREAVPWLSAPWSWGGWGTGTVIGRISADEVAARALDWLVSLRGRPPTCFFSLGITSPWEGQSPPMPGSLTCQSIKHELERVVITLRLQE